MAWHHSKSVEGSGLPSQTVSSASSLTPRPWLLSRNFRLIWCSQLISQIGDGVSKLALLWFVYAITGSALKTSIIGLLQTIPPIVMGPLIGVFVDRFPKKPILIGTDVLRGLLIGLIPCWVSTATFTVEYLYILVFFYSLATAVFGPALSASVPFVVKRSHFTAANALLQTTTSLGVIVGPALSGWGIAMLSSQEVLCVNAALYLLSAACLIPMRITRAKSRQVAREPAVRALAEGIRFAFVGQPIILLLTGTASLYTFGSGALTTLFPVFGRKLLDLGPVEVGYLWSAFGLGLLLTSIWLVGVTGWSLSKRVRLIAASSAMSGVALCAFVWAQDGLAAGALMAVVGIGFGTLTPIAWGVVQEISPTDMIGRVLALYSTGAMATAMAGMTFFGWVTQEWGERSSVMGIGLTLFATAAAALAVSRWVKTHQPVAIPGAPVQAEARAQAAT
jgi:DHA3 family macrolide efflux protein-like MFS transporter